jgi:PAS domain S-box-containing protein
VAQESHLQAGFDRQLFYAVFRTCSLGIALENLDGQPLFANPALCSMLGYSEQEMRAKHCAEFSPPDDAEKDWALFQQLRAGAIDHYQIDKRFIRKDGSLVWGRLSISLLNQTPKVVIALVEDITERKRTEDALKESQEKFAKAFRQSPMSLTITSAKTHRYLDVNETFEQMTGWQREEVIGRTPMDIGVWADAAGREQFVARLLTDGVIRGMELRYRTKHGVERVALGSGELIEIAHEPCVLAVIADITERKRAEEALAGINRRLIEAQEKERTRIARELHDDIGQRLALLAAEISQDWANLESRRLELTERTMEIADRVQSLSHELHSSKLEYLGMVAAMKSWCKEFAKAQRMQVQFINHNVTRAIPKEISLCLFRILQEGLHNASKHSGVQQLEVQLRENLGEIHLTISDPGRGFEIQNALQEEGLGISSMRERVKLVNGTILIESRPMSGTTIHVRVPFEAELNPQQAAG